MKHCPFCGSPRQKFVSKWRRSDTCATNRQGYIYCLNCKARGPLITPLRDYDMRNDRPNEDAEKKMRIQAELAWNGHEEPLPLFERENQ